MTDLAVSGLHKAYGNQPVLRGVDLAVPGGSLTAVLGPSGSGKTTLLRVVAGFERAAAGTVRLGGTVVEDGGTFVPPEHRGIGYVSQEGSLFPHLTVEANIGFGLPRRQRRGARVAELLAMVGLQGYERRYPHQLSGGQQQRVALARALAVGPGLVLLDEPFAGLDAGLRAAVRDDVRRILRDAGTTAVLVTHDQDEALSMADQVAVIRDGRIAQCGTPDDVYQRPADPDVARFVGDANLLDGVLVGDTVETPLGVLPAYGLPSAGSPTPVVAMVRPEQIEIRPVTGGPGGGAPGRCGVVAQRDYYGHDAVVAVTGDGIPAVMARVVGDPPAPGTPVTVALRGRARVWARTDR